jgi:hypothetical protein
VRLFLDGIPSRGRLAGPDSARNVAIVLDGFLLLDRWRVPPLAIVVFCVAAALLSSAVC